MTVNKVAPQFTAADLSLSPSTVDEGDTVTLSGQFTDPGTLEPIHGDDRLGRRLDSDRPQRAVTARSSTSATPGLFTYLDHRTST